MVTLPPDSKCTSGSERSLFSQSYTHTYLHEYIYKLYIFLYVYIHTDIYITLVLSPDKESIANISVCHRQKLCGESIKSAALRNEPCGWTQPNPAGLRKPLTWPPASAAHGACATFHSPRKSKQSQAATAELPLQTQQFDF